MMSNSILTSTKKNLGITEDDTSFDADILMHINSVFSTLTQLGIGPAEGFQIEDAVATWDSLLGLDPRLNSVKTYTFLRVRLLFDPPSTSYLINATEKQIQEIEWRLSITRENDQWTAPVAYHEPVGFLIDGGDGR